MIYKAVGVMSGSSLDGLDIAFVHFQENAGSWMFELINATCYGYDAGWVDKLRSAHSLNALQYQLLHSEFGQFIGTKVNEFVEQHNLTYQVQIISSHGHTVFHIPEKKMTSQLGHGAAIAASTGINTVSDLRALDVALGGQGAPIVPIGERLLLGTHDFFLNLGGIANISLNREEKIIAFDICPANRVLNMLANEVGKDYDQDGDLASAGLVIKELLAKLNAFAYYDKAFPKSLSNSFGTDFIFPAINGFGCSAQDALRTYVEHIAVQIKLSVERLLEYSPGKAGHSLLVTGGGALNKFLINRIESRLLELNVRVVIPEKNIVNFKEAVIIAFMGILRWREENNVLASVTGAKRNSIGGAVWMGIEA
jgi:anhydro-N-acetylmuramic acid kinase